MEFKISTYCECENGHHVYYREKTTDLNVLKEVLEKKVYSRPKLGFDVLPGEHWLDLGANIGAFSLYCLERQAFFSAYEPDVSNYAILQKNLEWATELGDGKPPFGNKMGRMAVTVVDDDTVTFWKDKSHSRRSVYYNRNKRKGYDVPNLPAKIMAARAFDGVKMDIEGSEGPIIDCRYIPKCKKLVLEYHTSVDPSIENLQRRIRILQSMFDHVHYPPEYERVFGVEGEFMVGRASAEPYYDRLIFCWND